jgi:cytochrome c-type protein NapC
MTAALALLLLFRPQVTHTRGGKVLAFVSLFVIPLLAALAGLNKHVERSKTTAFCISCHAMSDYGKSLYIDEPTHLPAAHWQNGRVPRERACYTCHTDYTLYGDYKAKLRGLRHVWVQYLGSAPRRIKLYHPYNNRECLHCHADTRSYLETKAHRGDDAGLARIAANRVSCLLSGCHDKVHDIDGLAAATLWAPGAADGTEKKP